jgi:hypothetical protein
VGDGTDTARSKVTLNVGAFVPNSSERNRATSSVAGAVTANVYVPAPVTTALTSNVTPAASLFGETVATVPPTAGSFVAVSVFSDHAVSGTLLSFTVDGRWCSSRVNETRAPVTRAPAGTLPTLNFRYVTSVSPFSRPATSLSAAPVL